LESLQQLLGAQGWKVSQAFIYVGRIQKVAPKIRQVASEVVLKKVHVLEEYKDQKKAKTGNLNLVESLQ